MALRPCASVASKICMLWMVKLERAFRLDSDTGRHESACAGSESRIAWMCQLACGMVDARDKLRLHTKKGVRIYCAQGCVSGKCGR